MHNSPHFADLVHRAVASTPSFLYCGAVFRAKYTALKTCLGTPLYLSIKANPDFGKLFGPSPFSVDGLEAASPAELRAAVTSANGGPIYVNNPAMNTVFLQQSLECGASIVIDSKAQLSALIQLERPRTLEVIIRLNSSVLTAFNPLHRQFKEDHFGVDLEQLQSVVHTAQKNGLKVRGFHLFQGSHSFFKVASSTSVALRSLVPYLRELLGYPFTFFNLGGGFPATWSEELNFDWASYRKGLAELSSDVMWAHESGRGVFSEAGYFVTKIIHTKELNRGIVAVCDGGIAQSFLLCKTENPLRKYSIPFLVSATSAPRTPCAKPVTFVGNSCSQDDVISKLPPGFPTPSPGDFVVFTHCGAYHSTYTAPRFLSLGAADAVFAEAPGAQALKSDNLEVLSSAD